MDIELDWDEYYKWAEENWIQYTSRSINIGNRRIKTLSLQANMFTRYRVMFGSEIVYEGGIFDFAKSKFEEIQSLKGRHSQQKISHGG